MVISELNPPNILLKSPKENYSHPQKRWKVMYYLFSSIWRTSVRRCPPKVPSSVCWCRRQRSSYVPYWSYLHQLAVATQLGHFAYVVARCLMDSNTFYCILINMYIYIHTILVGFDHVHSWGPKASSSGRSAKVGITLRPALEVSPNNTRCAAPATNAMGDAPNIHMVFGSV